MALALPPHALNVMLVNHVHPQVFLLLTVDQVSFQVLEHKLVPNPMLVMAMLILHLRHFKHAPLASTQKLEVLAPNVLQVKHVSQVPLSIVMQAIGH
jgi:hypothetical protein